MNVNKAEMLWFYDNKFSKYSQSSRKFPSVWGQLDDINTLLKDIEKEDGDILNHVSMIESERDSMLQELSELNGKSSSLLNEQKVLETTVFALESRMDIANTLDEANLVIHDREILVRDFDRFSGVIASVEKVLEYAEGTLARQFENLRFQLCAEGISVGFSAIETYTGRLLSYMHQQKSFASSLVFTKFVELLHVVSRVSSLFQESLTRSGRVYADAVMQLEKKFGDAREQIISKLIESYMSALAGSNPLSVYLRKSAIFVNSLIQQETDLCRRILSRVPQSLSQFGVALYGPLRTAIIASEDLADLRESAEVIRLELMDQTPLVNSVLGKLHRDISERLMFKTQAFLMTATEDPVTKTLESLSLVTGIVDRQTLYEFAHSAVGNCVHQLKNLGKGTSSNTLVLIDQLLRLREKMALIDCEYMGATSPVRHSGLRDQLRKVFDRGAASANFSPSVKVSLLIEDELRVACQDWNATIIAQCLSSGEDPVGFATKVLAEMRSVLKEGLEKILLPPIINSLQTMDAPGPAAAAAFSQMLG